MRLHRNWIIDFNLFYRRNISFLAKIRSWNPLASRERPLNSFETISVSLAITTRFNSYGFVTKDHLAAVNV